MTKLLSLIAVCFVVSMEMSVVVRAADAPTASLAESVK